MLKEYLRNGVLGCGLDVSDLEQGPVVNVVVKLGVT